MTGYFPELSGRAGFPDFVWGIMMMGADASMPPTSEKCRRPRRDAPTADQRKEERSIRKNLHPQIPFKHLDASSQPGDARAAGAEPPRARYLRKILAHNARRESCIHGW